MNYILDTTESIRDFIEYVKESNFEYAAIDVETNSVNERAALLWGMGFCFQEGEAFYLPIRDKAGNLFFDISLIKSVILKVLKNKKLLAHNGIYDLLVIENNLQIDLSPQLYADTILMKHCVDEERPFGLKEVSVRYLGPWADKAQKELYENIEANGGSTNKDTVEMFKADTHVLGDYCAFDCLLCFALFNLFKKRLDEEGLSDFFFNEEVMPLYKEVTIPMKKHGFPIDIEHFKKLNSDITKDISLLEDAIQDKIKEVVQQFNQNLLDKVYPAKRGGNFPKVMAELLNIPMPQKNGKTTLAKKAVEEYVLKYPEKQYFYNWVLGEEVEIDAQVIRKTQEICYFRDNPEMRYIFNLKSNHHLGWLFFTKLQEKPLSYTENKAPQCDDDFLESVANRHDFVKLLLDFKKLNKLKSTYIEGILDRQQDGVIYASMLQFGTTGGRYSCVSPNLQTLPRLKDEDAGLSELVLKYANAIKKGFISPKGYKIVNADYSALEPRMFAVMSGDYNLQQVFIKGEDLYSAIAKRVFKLEGSTFKKDADYIGKLYPEKRQQIKTLALAVTYGAEAGRIGDLMGVTRAEAQKLIDDYLNAFPGLRSYIKNCHIQAQKQGYVKTKFGRVRHLELAQKLYEIHGDKLLNNYMYIKSKNLFNTKRVYKTLLNNSTNFPIQGLAAGVVNRAMIAMMREFKNNKLNASIRMQVHDEIAVIAEECHAEQARKIMKSCMENVVKLEVPLVAEPIIGSNWADVK